MSRDKLIFCFFGKSGKFCGRNHYIVGEASLLRIRFLLVGVMNE